MAELAGRFRRTLAAKRRQRVRRGADEVVDVEQGSALARLVPSEMDQNGSDQACALRGRELIASHRRREAFRLLLGEATTAEEKAKWARMGDSPLPSAPTTPNSMTRMSDRLRLP